VTEHKRLVFGVQVDRSQSQPTDNKASLKGAWLCHMTILNFGGPIHISGMAEAGAVKFCTKADYIKSCQRDDKLPLKEAWFCSHDPRMYAQPWTLKKFSTAFIK